MSHSKTVVQVHNVSKVYKLYHKPFDRVKEAFDPRRKMYHKQFHALQNVSLELKRGEALGVIGGNGNGKSTLLKIIAQVLTPSTGSVKTYGKVSAILELTSNLKPEMTGRENIIYNLKLQGFTTKKEIAAKTKEIEEFAEIGDFIDQPVKLYSSGMKSRLGFGIATSVEPDILILDEVLAVGDFKFQQKCLAKINGMRENISLLFVSHSMNNIRLFCDRVIVLEKGELTFNGKPDDAIKYYLEQEKKKKATLKKKSYSSKSVKPFYGDIFLNTNKITDIHFSWLNADKNGTKTANVFEKLVLKISFKLLYTPKNIIVGIPIWTEDGIMVTGISTEMNNYTCEISNNICNITCEFKNIFTPNTYISIISINDGAENLARILNNKLISINTISRYFGFVSLEHKWHTTNKKKTDKLIHINDITLTVNKFDKSTDLYNGKSSYEELNNTIYKQIQDKYNPEYIFDIGANYGFTSIVFSKFFTNANIVLVEASSTLCTYIEKNLKNNIQNKFKLINAICAETSCATRTFSLNPSGSQDNRVIAENDNWEKESVPTVSLNSLFDTYKSNFYFIKIDTQGYEENVFKGGEQYLKNHNNWIIKTEFAPYWLKSQGSDPELFLKYLIEQYNVAEVPQRNRFKGDNLINIFQNTINKEEANAFIHYITKHNRNERGWCDLYIYPKELTI